jgi:hypothetical protein
MRVEPVLDPLIVDVIGWSPGRAERRDGTSSFSLGDEFVLLFRDSAGALEDRLSEVGKGA